MRQLRLKATLALLVLLAAITVPCSAQQIVYSTQPYVTVVSPYSTCGDHGYYAIEAHRWHRHLARPQVIRYPFSPVDVVVTPYGGVYYIPRQ
jgi:hypothetical protein